MQDTKNIYYVEVDHCGAFIVAGSEKEAGEMGFDLAEKDKERFFAIHMNGRPPGSERFGKTPFSKLTSHIYEAKANGFSISLEEIAGDITDVINNNEINLWYAEIKRKQKFNINSDAPGATRDFDYVYFFVAGSETDARKTAEKEFFWTAEKFADYYWNENCPPAEYFDLECSITYMRRVEIPGYRIGLKENPIV